MSDQLAIKTKIQLYEYQTFDDRISLINKIILGKHALISDSESGEIISQFMNQRYSAPIHLSEQKVFLYINSIAMRKSLPKQITVRIHRMWVNI